MPTADDTTGPPEVAPRGAWAVDPLLRPPNAPHLSSWTLGGDCNESRVTVRVLYR